MANQANLAELQCEAEKHRTAFVNTQEKIAAIEEGERRKREEKEAKDRELASLQRKRERATGWICRVETDIGEAKKEAAREVDMVCEGHGVALSHLRDTLLRLKGAELELAAFKEYEISLRAKIEAHQRQQSL